MVQIPNIVLNSLWIENVSRSKAMREQVSMFVNFDTSFEDIKALKNEMQTFVLDKENNRDFQPEIEIEVLGIAEMNKLELRVEIRHKSNWANEAVRAARRSKFMCALVLALRKVPIYGPGGGDAALGDVGKPSWSVAISQEEAIRAREKFNEDKDAKRLFPTKKPESPEDLEKGKSSSIDHRTSTDVPSEIKAIDSLNSRAPGADPTRDDAWNGRDDNTTIGRPSMDQPDLEEVRGLLHKESSRGKRKQGPVVEQPRQPIPPPIPIPIIPVGYHDYAQPPQREQAAAPASISRAGEEYQQVTPNVQQQGQGVQMRRPVEPQPPQGNAFAISMQKPIQAPRMTTQNNVGSNNPYGTPSPQQQEQQQGPNRE